MRSLLTRVGLTTGIAAVLLTADASAQEERDEARRRFAVFTNPVKPFIGLVNVGGELVLHPHLSLIAFNELAVFRSEYLESVAHPTYVAELGGHWYPFARRPWVDGLGVGGGYVLTLNAPEAPHRVSNLLMVELAWRVDLWRRFFVRPRAKYYAYLDGTGQNFGGAEVFIGLNFFE